MIAEVLQSLPVAVVITDAGNRIWRINDWAARLFATVPEQALGTPLDSWLDNLPWEMQPGATSTRHSLVFETVIHPAQGPTLPARCSTRWLPSPAERFACHVVWDLSEHQARESALREEIGRIRAILEMIPDAIITTNAEGIIETFNLAAEPMFQVTAEQVTGEPIQRLLPELSTDQRTTRESIPGGLLRRDFPPSGARREDGTTFPVEFSAGRMNVCGEGLLAWVIKDISARVRAEQQAEETRERLIHADKMASLGSLVAGIAHEINTPLGTSVTAASHLREHSAALRRSYQQAELKRSQLEDYLDQAAEAGRILETNLSRACELIRSFKQIAVDRSNSEQRRFKLREYLEEVLLSLHPRLKKTAHRMQLECDPALAISSYPGALSQVLSNLIINSLLHGYAPGTSGTLRIQVEKQGRWVNICYADDGNGIPQAHLQRVFEPFFTTRRGQGGSGLGLHIVYNLVTQALSGRIECSNQERGARFDISIPDLSAGPET